MIQEKYKISFGTDGWRAIIADDFNVNNLRRLCEAVAAYLKLNNTKPSIVIGYDTRFAGKLFAETAAQVLASKGVKVMLSSSFCSTPMLSLGVVENSASMGLIITASHNPPSYSGVKLKGSYGGPLLASAVAEIEELIPDSHSVDTSDINLKSLTGKGLVEYVDLEALYIKHLEKNFDIKSLQQSQIRWAYDAMFGAGQQVIKKMFPDVRLFHAELNPSFNERSPEPIASNLPEISEFIRNNKVVSFGLATDGDADRLGLFDSKGNFIDSHHMILLLIHYFMKYQNRSGKVITTCSATSKIKALCQYYGIECEITRIGFKYICEKILKEDVLLGGEESGGIAISGHLPERDGIWVGLVFLEMLVKTQKTLEELISEIYQIVGKFDVERVDLKLTDFEKIKIIQKCKEGHYHHFGKEKVSKVETIDGFKYYLDGEKWVMIRASGTESVLRTYAQANSKKEAIALLDELKETILSD
jgi:phosphomannomutase